jgi:hypothetical protein
MLVFIDQVYNIIIKEFGFTKCRALFSIRIFILLYSNEEFEYLIFLSFFTNQGFMQYFTIFKVDSYKINNIYKKTM